MRVVPPLNCSHRPHSPGSHLVQELVAIHLRCRDPLVASQRAEDTGFTAPGLRGALWLEGRQGGPLLWGQGMTLQRFVVAFLLVR